MMTNTRAILSIGAAAALIISAPETVRAQSDSAAAANAVAAFHAALEAGDSLKVLSFLTDDVRILESGGIEDKEKFRSGHLRADINYAKSVKSERAVTSVVVSGGAAWVVSSSVATGESNGRAINSQGAELMVLSKVGGEWKIRAIHWSSRARRAP
jgi:ketosteroid isomerase-like protein